MLTESVNLVVIWVSLCFTLVVGIAILLNIAIDIYQSSKRERCRHCSRVVKGSYVAANDDLYCGMECYREHFYLNERI